jgi:hypothetical protein
LSSSHLMRCLQDESHQCCQQILSSALIQGCIHVANNASSGMRTKHIDTRIHFVRELTQGNDKLHGNQNSRVA